MKVTVACVAGLLSLFWLSVPAAYAQSSAAETLRAAEKALGAATLTSVQYSGTGASYFVGQAQTPGGPWLRYALTNYVADVDYAARAMRQTLDRTQADGGTPFGGAHAVWLVAGTDAWNQVGSTSAVQFRDPSGGRVAEQRSIEIWLTPVGFVKAAQANRSTVSREGRKTVVTVTLADGRRIKGTLDAQHRVERTESVIDNPVAGDFPIVMTFSGYRRFGAVMFPARIVETVGGFEALDLQVTAVVPNGAVAIGALPATATPLAPHTVVKSDRIGEGVWYITGASHHSLLVEFADYLVVLEAPQDEARSEAVIAEAHRLVPAKPIRYVANTHSHFDHLGGARAYAAEGATLLAAAPAKTYYEQVLNAPHTVVPDRLQKAGGQVRVEGVDTVRVLTDGRQRVELHVLSLAHSSAILLPYIPSIKLAVQADLGVTPVRNAQGEVLASPAAAELLAALRARGIEIAQIAGIHGRITPMSDLVTAAGQ